MQLTSSFLRDDVLSPDIRDRYDLLETNNAAAVLRATSPAEYADLLDVLDTFTLTSDRWLVKGGNRGDIAEQLDQLFRDRGWLETRIDTEVKGYFHTNFQMRGRDYVAADLTEVPTMYSEGFRVDNHKGRMIVDVEWNAKDGNLDRDLSAYRSWHELGLINGAAIITKDRLPLLKLARLVWADYQDTLEEAQRTAGLPIDLTTSTTTSFDKAKIRLDRQGAGTCPVLIIGVTDRTWDGTPFTG